MTTDVSNGVLANRIGSLETQVNKLEVKLDAYAAHFITAEVYEIKHRELELQVQGLDMRLNSSLKNNVLRMWWASTLSATSGILLALLIQFYLEHQHG